jgi:kynureninase
VEQVQQNELGNWIVTMVQSWETSYEGWLTVQHDDLDEMAERLTAIFNAVPDAALEEFSIMNIYKSDLFKFITGDMVKDNPVTMTIDHVQMEQLENGGRKESKPVIYFQGNKKGAVLNKTNAKALAAEYGGETDDWKGKQVKLFAEAGTWFGVSGHALRMMPFVPVNGNGKAPKLQPEQPAPEDDTFGL